MPAVVCPRCGLKNPGSASQCDCGCPLSPGAPWPVDMYERRQGGGLTAVIFGAIAVMFGVVITVGTHYQAVQAGGGRYLIAYGPIVFGVSLIVRGVKAMSDRPKTGPGSRV